MKKDIPLKIEILSSGEDAEYRVSSAREIEIVLKNIFKSRSRIALYYSEENEFILTTLLDVDASGLWLDQSRQPQENNRLLKSNKLIFVGSHAQVKVQFTSDHATSTTYQGQPAFFLKLPDSIYRLQRREYFRLTTPVSDALLCVIPVDEAVERHAHEITIMDISGGGVGLTCTELDTVLVPGNTYENCKIDLHEVGEFFGTIEVKNLISLTTPSGKTVRRAGCEFKNLDGTSTMLLQRYVTAMQRAKINE